ncbi:hypothetical protein POTOM_015384 [Populus tomentosa]|uniref:Nascent polypeptide-associated complex subunit beta n=2 Tax=Populus TaxID=3689 RepID=A0A8X8ADF0_POPTO|nr:hypothetical protein POTOM_015384 [Populus tomentosa]
MECLGKSSIPNSIDHDLDLEQFHKRCPPNTDGRAFDSGCDGVAGGVALVLLIAGLLDCLFGLNYQGSGRQLLERMVAYEDGTNLELVDESLDPKEYEAENAKKIIEIALICTQSSPALRPTMSETVGFTSTSSSVGFVKDTNFVAKYIQMNREKLMKMAGSVRTGGKGTMRRKKKAVHKSSTTDDKKLQSTLKRIGVNTIPAIEEVNIFKDDLVIQFVNPKVQASVVANTWVITGTPQTRKLQDILPGIINQLGPDNLDNLRKLAEQFQKEVPSGEAGAAQEDDDDVPELVGGETFETVAEEGQK